MAASYSSFLTTQYYSPIFNTALFDGPFRIYFSQSYESVALKIYHLLQSQDLVVWTEYKKWSEKTRKHGFILIYPSAKDLKLAFDDSSNQLPLVRHWDEGVILGILNPQTDDEFLSIYQNIIQELKQFIAIEKNQAPLEV